MNIKNIAQKLEKNSCRIPRISVIVYILIVLRLSCVVSSPRPTAPDRDGGDSAPLPAGLQRSDRSLRHHPAGTSAVPHSHQASGHAEGHAGQ